jgi:hypothetical protein
MRYEYGPKSSIQSFCDFISELFGILTHSIWESLRPGFTCGFVKFSSRSLGQHFSFGSDSPFDGVISFFARKYHGNIHDLGAIFVPVSGVNWSQNAKHIIEFEGS